MQRLVVAEVGLAVLLTLGAGLLVRSFIRLQQVNAGFDANGVLSAAIALPEATYDSTRARAAAIPRTCRRCMRRSDRRAARRERLG